MIFRHKNRHPLICHVTIITTWAKINSSNQWAQDPVYGQFDNFAKDTFWTSNIHVILLQSQCCGSSQSWYLILYYATQKTQPIGIQESHCIFNSIKSDLPILHHTYIASIVFTTVFSMAWNATLSRINIIVPITIPLVTWIFLAYTLSLGFLCVTKKYMWLVGYSIVYHSKALHIN